MYCLKCGKDTKSEQVFCDACLQVMDRYPVKSDTPIHLPQRKTSALSKKQPARKRAVPPEEQVEHLKSTNRRLIFSLLSVILVLGVCIGYIIYDWTAPQPEADPRTGSNFTYSAD